jgi:hypothetical protein
MFCLLKTTVRAVSSLQERKKAEKASKRVAHFLGLEVFSPASVIEI